MIENDSITSLLALVIFIPLGSKQHFIPFQPPNFCLLADMCNHTWIPECGYYLRRNHNRLFIDECDMFEYNCDNNFRYRVTNYSDCFFACPIVPKLLTRVQDFYIYYADGRRMLYTPDGPPGRRHLTTRYTTPRRKTPGETWRPTKWHERRRYTPQATGKYKPWSDDTTTCGPCGRKTTPKKKKVLKSPLEEILAMYIPKTTAKRNARRTIRRPTKRTTRRTARRPTKRTTKRTTKNAKQTTQILRTGTLGTVIIEKVTVWKNGTMYYKVLKGVRNVKTTIIEGMIHDSDFLE